MKRVAYLGAAPAYYFVPFLKKLASVENIDLTVFWGSRETTQKYFEKQFGRIVDESKGLLEGYNYYFLKNLIGKETYQKGFWGLNSFEFFKIFKKEKYDFLIVHGWQYLNNINAIIAAKKNGVKVLLRAETPLNQEAEKSKLKLAIKKPLLKALFRLIDGFLYIGEENRLFYKSYGIEDDRLFFTPYSVDNEKFQKYRLKNLQKRDKFRTELGISKNDVVYIFVGKLIYKKRPFTLIRAFEKLQKQFDNVKLLIVGSGELEDSLKKYVKQQNIKNVIFAGYQSQENLPKFLLLSDVFVLPSGVGETWGLAVNEALNFGLPVILSNMVGSAKDLATKNNGFIFKLDDIDDLSNCMKRLIDPKLRKKMSEESLKLVNIYSPENVVKGILKAIEVLS